METKILIFFIFIFMLSVTGFVLSILAYKKHFDEHQTVKKDLTVGRRMIFSEEYDILIQNQKISFDSFRIPTPYFNLTDYKLDAEYMVKNKIFQSQIFTDNASVADRWTLLDMKDEIEKIWQISFEFKVYDPNNIIEATSIIIWLGDGTREAFLSSKNIQFISGTTSYQSDDYYKNYFITKLFYPNLHIPANSPKSTLYFMFTIQLQEDKINSEQDSWTFDDTFLSIRIIPS